MNEAILLSAVQTVVISMVIYFLQRAQSNKDKQSKRHEQAKTRESLLLLELVMASAKLSYACAVALRRGKVNGEVEEGVNAYQDAKEKYYDFLNQQAKEHLK